MTLFDVFRTKDGRFWFALWDIAMTKPVFLSNLYASLPELLSEMMLTATEKKVDLSLMIDSFVVPAKFERISIWQKRRCL